ncbi:hypothetical protein F4805DRAFT_98021 [Annulohypoxylon moriforme]|nr:hypothetical protein F4805DRAFT_98021 [Annulohypoxylon moriforme]
MLSSIGRAAIRRLVATSATTSSNRIVVSSLSANSLRSGRLFVRSFATPAKSKASTTKSATKPAATKGRTKTTAKAKTTKATKATKATKTTKSAKSKSTRSTKSKAGAKAKAKPKAKPKPRKRRPLSPERKNLLERRALKKTAILSEPKLLADSAWTMFVVEQIKGSHGGPNVFRDKISVLGQEFRALPASRLQQLQAAAQQNKLTNAATYKAWVETHTPQDIHAANKARRLLKKKHNYPPKSQLKLIRDGRLPKQPTTPYSLFTKARWASGDFANRTVADSAKQIGQEWRNLPDAERLPYEDLFKASSAQYAKEVGDVLQRKVTPRPKPKA